MRSASSRDGGGSLGCRVGGSLRILRILQATSNSSHHHPAPNCHRSQTGGATVRLPASDAEDFGSFADALRLLGGGGRGGAGGRRRGGGECLDLETAKTVMLARNILSAATEGEEGMEREVVKEEEEGGGSGERTMEESVSST